MQKLAQSARRHSNASSWARRDGSRVALQEPNMPDITMCTGEGCPRAETCYRKRATPSEYLQAYFTKPPYSQSNHEICEYYWSLFNR